MTDLIGTEGDDTLVGSDGADVIQGLGGDDIIDGGLGADNINGGSGRDVIRFTSVMTTSPTPTAIGLLDGGEGFDVIYANSVQPTRLTTTTNLSGQTVLGLSVGNQIFEIRNTEEMFLGSANDYLPPSQFYAGMAIHTGGGSDFAMTGGAVSVFLEDGDDEVFVSGSFGTPATAGLLVGGEGTDTLSFNIMFTVDIAAGTAFAGASTYTISGFERYSAVAVSGYTTMIYGSDAAENFSVRSSSDDGSVGITFHGRGGDDVLTGSRGNDTLSGGDGQDSVAAGDGNDTLDGGTGADILDGGAGNDRIHYDAADNAAQVTGGTGTDVLVVTGAAAPSFNLIAQGFELAEVTQTDTGANPWSSIVRTHSAGWALLQQNTTNDDGTRVQIDLDPANAVSTSQVWSSFDAQGRLSTFDQFFDSGTRTFINVDEANNQSFTQDWFNYDSQGRLDSEDVLYDNGSRTFINLDQAGTQSFTQDWFTYDAQARLDSEDVYHDNGTRTFINLDQDNSQSWSQAWFTYDALGRLDTQDVINDDGSHTFTDYDQASTENYTLVAFVYNAAGALTQQVTAFDDGTTSYTYY